MTDSAKTSWDDTILPFQLDDADVRGRVVRLDGALQEILGQHNYPTPVAALVAEAALLTAMMGQTIKLRWKLSLQIRGSGPIRLVATDYYAPTKEGEPAHIRAWASFDESELSNHKATPFEALGEGMFAVLLDQGDGNVPYSGVTGLSGGSLASCAEAYFSQSEQLPTRFAVATGESEMAGKKAGWRGGAIMLQHLPKGGESARGERHQDHQDTENWNRAALLMETVELLELIGPYVSPTELLLRLFHAETPRVFGEQKVHFGCTCGPEKVKQAMSIYSSKDIATMTTDEGTVTADCQFCGAHYIFQPEELGKDSEPTQGD